MPQFDLATYPSQISWLILSFSLLLIVFKKFIIPYLGKIHIKREEKIQDDLSASEKTENKFLDMQRLYLVKIEAAKKQAATLVDQTMTELEIFETEQLRILQKTISKQLDDFKNTLDQERKNLENPIKELVDQSLQSLLPKILGIGIEKR